MTIATALHELARANPGRLALRGGDEQLTLAELDLRARVAARVILDRRLARVTLAAPGSIDLAVAFLGALYAGRAVVPLHVDTPAAQRAEVVDPRALQSGGPIDAPIDGDVALVLSTSGTTGAARGVVIGHDSLARHTAAVARVLALTPADVVLAVLPLAHSYGCRMALLAPLLCGATVVIAERFSARASLALLAEHRVTWVPVVPTMLAAWVALPGAPTALCWCLSAGAPLPDALYRAAEARLGCEVRQGYGLSEASFATLDAPPARRGMGTVGRALPGVELALAASGEVLVRGDNLMRGYEEGGVLTPIDRRDWLATGDVGRLDASGRLVIMDRLKDVVLVGGYTVHPAEVEAAIAAHPAVQAVAVVGRPHPFSGEELVAHVVTTLADPREIEPFICERLVTYKVPRVWRRCAELPLGPSGKVLRRVLRGLPQGGDRT